MRLALLLPLASCASVLGIEGLPGEATVDGPTIDGPDSPPDTVPSDNSSCASIHAAMPAAPSGVYEIDLGSVYCDMTTAGGGWTLVLAYRHAAADPAPLVPGQAPQDPATGYSQMSAEQLQALPFTDLRFFCTTDQAPRVMHFVISVPEIGTYFRGLGPNSANLWMGSVTQLAEHTALLPAATNSFRTGPTIEENMTFFPFLEDGGQPHCWSLDAFEHRWECDDRRTGAEAETLHHIWAR